MWSSLKHLFKVLLARFKRVWQGSESKNRDEMSNLNESYQQINLQRTPKVETITKQDEKVHAAKKQDKTATTEPIKSFAMTSNTETPEKLVIKPEELSQQPDSVSDDVDQGEPITEKETENQVQLDSEPEPDSVPESELESKPDSDATMPEDATVQKSVEGGDLSSKHFDESGKRISKLAQMQAQEEMPIALVQDEPLSVLPKDLYIPPEALMVILEAFEGPLDLLLYLIRRQNLDVLNIPIAEITRQYMDYIALMQDLDLEVAAEYLVMAAMLAEIKSRMLLPRPNEEEDEEDPRAELVRRLQEYERYKKAAEDIEELPRMERDIHVVEAEPPEIQRRIPQPDVDLKELIIVFREVLQRADMFSSHQITKEPLSVRERMSIIMGRVSENDFTDFQSLFTPEEGRMGVVVSFLAVLELVKERIVDFVQSEPFAPIYLKPAGGQVEEDVVVPDIDGSEFD